MVTKYDRRGYRPRRRPLIITNKNVYILNEKDFRLKLRIPFTNLTSSLLSFDYSLKKHFMLLVRRYPSRYTQTTYVYFFYTFWRWPKTRRHTLSRWKLFWKCTNSEDVVVTLVMSTTVDTCAVTTLMVLAERATCQPWFKPTELGYTPPHWVFCALLIRYLLSYWVTCWNMSIA